MAVSTIGWLINNWIRAKHGYALGHREGRDFDGDGLRPGCIADANDAAQFGELEVGTDPAELSAAADRSGGDRGSIGERCQAGTDQRVARIPAFAERGDGEAVSRRGREILGRVDRQVGASVEHRALDLLDEHALATDLVERNIETDVAGVYRCAELFAAQLLGPVTYSASDIYRSHFARFNFDGVDVEIMGDLHRREGDGWAPAMSHTARQPDPAVLRPRLAAGAPARGGEDVRDLGAGVLRPRAFARFIALSYNTYVLL